MPKVNFKANYDHTNARKYIEPAHKLIKQRPPKKRIKLQPSTKGFAS
jgi:hypothetical protein